MRQMKKTLLLLLVILLSAGQVFAARQDLVFSGVYEAAIDLPRIYFLVKQDTGRQPSNQKKEFELHYAFLDTGASGILLSSETAESMGVQLDAKAQYVDVGIGGKEYFNVSESLNICLAGMESQNPENQNAYKCFGPWRVQVKKEAAGLLGEPIDVIGMPVMVGNVAILHSGATNSLEYFAADIKRENDIKLPKVDFKVPLKLKKFTNPKDPCNIGPLPVSVGNPVIDDVILSYNGKSSKSTWLLDTGATVSLISSRQAKRLGLMDENGKTLATPAFSLPVGGIGAMTMVNGYEVDRLTIPTTGGYNLIFKNARIGVQDIKYFDIEKNAEVLIDGVFGSNFLCASAKMEGMLPSDVGETPFDNIVIDLRNNTLGFDLRENPKPPR